MPTKKTTIASTSVKPASTKSRTQAKKSGATTVAVQSATAEKHFAKPTTKTLSSLDALRKAFAVLSIEEQKILLQEWTTQISQNTVNALTKLVEVVQKQYGANLITEVWTEGASHVPVVYCKITLPDGTEYTASGKNQKVAKQLAAEEALADIEQQ